MLPAWYLVDIDGSSARVWARDGRGRLENRAVTLGAYDEWLDQYEITEGLSLDDYIAFPREELTEGTAVERFDPSGFESAGSGSGSHGGMMVSEAVAVPIG